MSDETERAIEHVAITAERAGAIRAYMRVHAYLNAIGHFEAAERIIDLMEAYCADDKSEKAVAES